MLAAIHTQSEDSYAHNFGVADAAISYGRVETASREREIFGITGVGTPKRLALTLISPMNITLLLSERCPGFLNGLGGYITDGGIRLLVQESRLQSGPSARPARWTSTATLSTEPPSAT